MNEIFCYDVGSTIHKDREFMVIWRLIEFYHNFGITGHFYLEDE